MEQSAEGDQLVLPELYAFDPDYLYVGAFVHALNLVRPDTEHGPHLDADSRKRFANMMRGIFMNPSGRPGGPSKAQVRREYLGIMGELEEPTPERDISCVELRWRAGHYEVGSFPVADDLLKLHADEEIGDIEAAEARLALRSVVIVRPGCTEELKGLEKVVAYHIPSAILSRDSQKMLFPDPRRDRTATAVSWSKLEDRWWTSIETEGDRDEKNRAEEFVAFKHDDPTRRLIENWADIYRNFIDDTGHGQRDTKRDPYDERYSLVGYSLLACKYGYRTREGDLGTETARRYVGQAQDLGDEPIASIPDLDTSREWRTAGRWFRQMVHRTLMATSPLAKQCGVAKDELLALMKHDTGSRS